MRYHIRNCIVSAFVVLWQAWSAQALEPIRSFDGLQKASEKARDIPNGAATAGGQVCGGSDVPTIAASDSGSIASAKVKSKKRLTSKEVYRKDKGHWFRFFASERNFDRKQHDLSDVEQDIIDGHPAYGLAREAPQCEFDRFDLVIDGHAIAIPRDVYSHFYEPDFGYEDRTYMVAFWGNDYQSVFVVMNGGDGIGSYSVIWHLRVDGRHSYSLIPGGELFFDFMDH